MGAPCNTASPPGWRPAAHHPCAPPPCPVQYTLLVVDSRTVSQNAFFLRPTWSNLAAYVEW